jgi:hypothetical protein
VVNLDKQMLEGAPTYDADEDFLWTPDYGQRVDKYYNARYAPMRGGLENLDSRLSGVSA